MSRLAALLLVARAGARRGAATSAAALHPDLYFRQVRAGDLIALDASELSAFARQMNNFMSVSYTHLTLPTKRIV